TDYVMLHSACVNVMPTARTLPLCAVAGTLRLKSNGESKIAESKAALCYGFAIALRTLFFVIRRCDFSRTPFVIASEQRERGNQPYMKLESWGFYDIRLLRLRSQ
ncbi:MAG: hypothetical protein K2N69_07180, partial [Helicobacter sp.]|nr:hypothetical protein [Helicobacter sp.]